MGSTKEKVHPRRGLVEARIGRGWSQQEVADQLGTTPLTVSRWERGITRPSPYFRTRLAQLFGKTAEELDLQDISLNMPQERPAGQDGASASPPVSPVIDPVIPSLQSWRLFGRDHTLADLKTQLRSGNNLALCALDGMPGMGKTALAIALAHDTEVGKMFPNGILWVGLGPDPNITRALSRWGTLLGIPEARMGRLTSVDSWAMELRMAIGQRTMLLIIDDAWSIEDALNCMVGGPNCSYLLTTRSRTVANSFASKHVTQVTELNEQESLTLLADLAGEMVYQEQEAAQALVRAVGGLPLALVLIGRYLHLAAASGQPRRLRAAFARMWLMEERLRLAEPQAPIERHSSLPANVPFSLSTVIAASVQRLPGSAQTALSALSTFPAKPQSFSEEAALAVADCPVETLDVLYDAGLLESTGPERYALHQTIADFGKYHQDEGRQTREPSQAAESAAGRLVTYYAGFVEQHRSDYSALEQESANILMALEVAYEHGMGEHLVRIILDMAGFLEVRSLYDLAERHLQRAEQAVRSSENRPALPALLLHRGSIAQKRGEYPQADALYQEGMALAREAGQTDVLCALLAKRGWVADKRGLYANALDFLHEGLALARQYGYMHLLPDMLNELGTVADEQGNTQQAITLYQEGLALARQREDPQQTCVLLLNLGATEQNRGNFTQAEAYQMEGLALARQLHHHEWTCLLLHNLGVGNFHQGNLDQAEAYHTEGLALARRIEHREWMSHLLGGLGDVAIQRGAYAQAEWYLRESLDLAQQIGKPSLLADMLDTWGVLLLKLQRIDEAEATFQQMLTVIPEENTLLLGQAQFGLAQVASARGNVTEARRLAEMSLVHFEAIEEVNHKAKVIQLLRTLPEAIG